MKEKMGIDIDLEEFLSIRCESKDETISNTKVSKLRELLDRNFTFDQTTWDPNFSVIVHSSLFFYSIWTFDVGC